MDQELGDGPHAVSESTVFNRELTESFSPHQVLGRELSDFLSASPLSLSLSDTRTPSLTLYLTHSRSLSLSLIHTHSLPLSVSISDLSFSLLYMYVYIYMYTYIYICLRVLKRTPFSSFHASLKEPQFRIRAKPLQK